MSVNIKNFRHAKARQPEIIRSIQKDDIYTNELSNDVSDILRLACGPKKWIKYNHLCGLLSQIVYHGFATMNNLQTLGEEYTGIIMIGNKYVSIPSKTARLITIILEFGGEILFLKLLTKLDKEIHQNEEILPDAKDKLKNLIKFLTTALPYFKVLHKTFFYFGSANYQFSKRLTGINYILIRHWLKPDFSLVGYKILGFLSLTQLAISASLASYEMWSNRKLTKEVEKTIWPEYNKYEFKKSSSNCILCLEQRINSSVTPCGHIFCWNCILEWLDDHDDCPVCRDNLKKSNIVQLQNFL